MACRIITSDLHLNDTQRDADRWKLFPWLRDQVRKRQLAARSQSSVSLLILGDLTDAKDRHPATLVNRVVGELASLALMCPTTVLLGNHDCVDRASPFFAFISMIPNLRFIVRPTYEDGVALLPNTREEGLRSAWSRDELARAEYVFCHQTFEGALAENGTRLHGVDPAVFDCTDASVYSGDVHMPQKVKGTSIEYVGAPYRVHFGDAYRGRVLLLTNGEASNLYFPARRRELVDCQMLEQVRRLDYEMGSQVKVRVHLRRADLPTWPELRQSIRDLAEKRGWELLGPELVMRSESNRIDTYQPEQVSSDPRDEVVAHARAKKLGDDMRDAGLAFLKEAQQ